LVTEYEVAAAQTVGAKTRAPASAATHEFLKVPKRFGFMPTSSLGVGSRIGVPAPLGGDRVLLVSVCSGRDDRFNP